MNKLTALTLLVLCAISFAVGAGELPDYYPQAFYTWGKIDHLDTKQGIMVIDDKSVNLAPNTKVYTTSSRFGTVSSLHVGMVVGIYRRNHQAAINEVWVLPDDYKPDYRPLIIKK